MQKLETDYRKSWHSLLQPVNKVKLQGRDKLEGRSPRRNTVNNVLAPAPSGIMGNEVKEPFSLSQYDHPSAEMPENSLLDFGFPRNMQEKFEFGQELGRGGNGVVSIVRDRVTSKAWACKSIPKVLSGSVSELKRKQHRDSVRREVDIQKKLKGCLNVAKFEAVYEDDDYVHIIMEWCKGGELYHAIGDRHYSERTVASYMRAVLKTLAQCHALHILHRDIKPGNFMLLDETDKAPLKAIDFGLATYFTSKDVPRDDLGFEGTPYFMAPEVLSSKVYPASDIWSAGVMAFQLLTGHLPFNDKRNPHRPSVSQVWKSILMDKIDFNRSFWQGISPEAKDFVKMLLNRDPAKRPTAKEALQHPFLRGKVTERKTGQPIAMAVVQRIQRFSQSGMLKRSVLQMIAQEILDRQDMQCGMGQDVVTGKQSLEQLFDEMKFNSESMSEEEMVAELQKMGHNLADGETEHLVEVVSMGGRGMVSKDAFAASQIDWKHLQQNEAELFLQHAEAVFKSMDADSDGIVQVDEIIAQLREKLPLQEVHEAVQSGLRDVGLNMSSKGVDFKSFMQMLKVSSVDSLDLYDDRLGSPGSLELLAVGGILSNHSQMSDGPLLGSVPE
eukprot:TRINITY_DN1345_c1_g1_i1.p1 TRINITY_DN1345_c1_g1~~TRINITY_DN1345_c1_g1_i1.p1  ORF type:complete len:612 (+),score=74.41 TRINITY_DN1345_c1_g1_i1:1003-2838(+)